MALTPEQIALLMMLAPAQVAQAGETPAAAAPMPTVLRLPEPGARRPAAQGLGRFGGIDHGGVLNNTPTASTLGQDRKLDPMPRSRANRVCQAVLATRALVELRQRVRSLETNLIYPYMYDSPLAPFRAEP